jgi:predicted transport protein
LKNNQYRDVKEIGHLGTEDCELTIADLNDFEATKYLIH